MRASLTGSLTTPLDRLAAIVVAGPCLLLRVPPSLVYVSTLGVAMFFPPSLPAAPYDRIMLAVLVFSTLVAAFVRRERLIPADTVVLPMLALAVLATASALARPFDVQTWSNLATKFLVPFAAFCMARVVFSREVAVRRFFHFVLAATVYLTFTAVAFLVGADSLIWPRHILDPDLGLHVERARGPFLQAVANGTAINALAVLAAYWLERTQARRAAIVPLLIGVPLAIVATMTRAVWLAFGCSMALMWAAARRRPSRRVGAALLAASVAAVVVVVVASGGKREGLSERLHDEDSVEYRFALYSASWELFAERPLLGWGINQAPTRIRERLVGWDGVETATPHNTYVEMVLEHGLVGLGLWVWIIARLLAIGRGLRAVAPPDRGRAALDAGFFGVSRIVLVVYLINGTFVVMNYQFVNMLVFTVAGIASGLAARLREGAGEAAQSAA
jgi:O-antigen ligase